MSIGDRPRNILAGYPSVRSGPVIDDHLLSEQTPDAGSDEVSHSVIATACACRMICKGFARDPTEAFAIGAGREKT